MTITKISDREIALRSENHELRQQLAEAQPYNADPSYTTVQLAEMILSDCGCSSNNTSLVSRVANRIDAHMQAAQPVRGGSYA